MPGTPECAEGPGAGSVSGSLGRGGTRGLDMEFRPRSAPPSRDCGCVRALRFRRRRGPSRCPLHPPSSEARRVCSVGPAPSHPDLLFCVRRTHVSLPLCISSLSGGTGFEARPLHTAHSGFGVRESAGESASASLNQLTFVFPAEPCVPSPPV